MLVAMENYPPMGINNRDLISSNPFSLRNDGYVSIPPVYMNSGDKGWVDIQKAYLENGLSGGLGLDVNSFLAGGTGTLLLLGGAVLLLIIFMGKDKRAAKKEEMAKAREDYKNRTKAISAKYGKLGLGL